MDRATFAAVGLKGNLVPLIKHHSDPKLIVPREFSGRELERVANSSIFCYTYLSENNFSILKIVHFYIIKDERQKGAKTHK